MCNNTLRTFLKLHKSTPMCMLNGEMGIKEIAENIENRMLNIQCNIARGEVSKMSTIFYKWIKALYDKNIYKSVWLNNIKTILDNIALWLRFGYFVVLEGKSFYIFTALSLQQSLI